MYEAVYIYLTNVNKWEDMIILLSKMKGEIKLLFFIRCILFYCVIATYEKSTQTILVGIEDFE